MNKRIIKDYLESLKEDKELDYIFPLLLESMGMNIISTPKNSKGMPQFGKDVVAVGKGSDGIKYRWYFELKGNAAKDINDTTFNCKDGVRESILASKDVPYEDSSICKFNQLPWKIIFVHNGILVENTRIQFNNFISREFPKGGFERWDIDRLTDLFFEYLFDECLFCDNESYFILKKILVLLDAPGWNTKNLDLLIDLQLKACPTNKNTNRKTQKCFTSLNLLLCIIYKYSQEAHNLLPAKKSSERVVLKVWHWILKNELEKNKIINKLYGQIINTHLKIYSIYFDKVIPLATTYKGLYIFGGGESEKVCYPLRCYDFLSDIIYYFIMYNYVVYHKNQKDKEYELTSILTSIIKNNSGYDLPLLDTHSIPLLLLIRFIFEHSHTDEDEIQLQNLIIRIVENIIIKKNSNDMFPELYGNRKEVAKSIYNKSPEYCDSSSLYLMILIEIIAWMNNKILYNLLRKEIKKSSVNLQISYPINSSDLEINLFDHKLNEELSVETNITLPRTLSQFKKEFKKKYNSIDLKTLHSNFPYIIILAHIHYETDLFPDFINFGYLQELNYK